MRKLSQSIRVGIHSFSDLLSLPRAAALSGLMAAVWCSPLALAQYHLFLVEDAEDAQLLQEGVTAAGAVLIGIESFASSTLAAGQGQALDRPVLAPGEANGPFPQGTNPATGIILQTNQLGGEPAQPSPAGVLYASAPTSGGIDFTRVGPENPNMSLDVLVAPPNLAGMVRAVTFQAVIEGGNTAEVRVFDNQNNLLAFQTFSAEAGEAMLIAVLAPLNETFLRINLWAPSGYGDAGNFYLFAVPEPANAALGTGLALCLILLSRHLRRRRRGACPVQSGCSSLAEGGSPSGKAGGRGEDSMGDGGGNSPRSGAAPSSLKRRAVTKTRLSKLPTV